MSRQTRAIVKNFKTSKGYGFCTDANDGTTYFIHSTSILNGAGESLQPGDGVELIVRHLPKGPAGVDVRLIRKADERENELTNEWVDENDLLSQ